MSKYAKLFAALGGVLAIAADALADGIVAAPEVEAVVIAAVSAFFVYIVKNKPPVVA